MRMPWGGAPWYCPGIHGREARAKLPMKVARMLAEVHLEFLGRSLWWVAIGVLVAVALFAYGILIWRQNRVPATAGGRGGGVGGGRRVAGPTLWQMPLPAVAVIAGVVT